MHNLIREYIEKESKGDKNTAVSIIQKLRSFLSKEEDRYNLTIVSDNDIISLYEIRDNKNKHRPVKQQRRSNPTR